jgi:hypothetical protein
MQARTGAAFLSASSIDDVWGTFRVADRAWNQIESKSSPGAVCVFCGAVSNSTTWYTLVKRDAKPVLAKRIVRASRDLLAFMGICGSACRSILSTCSEGLVSGMLARRVRSDDGTLCGSRHALKLDRLPGLSEDLAWML